MNSSPQKLIHSVLLGASIHQVIDVDTHHCARTAFVLVIQVHVCDALLESHLGAAYNQVICSIVVQPASGREVTSSTRRPFNLGFSLGKP